MKANALRGALLALCVSCAGAVAPVSAENLKTVAGTTINWTSVYVGVHAGYSSADLDWRSNYPDGNPALRPTDFGGSDTIAGSHIGYMVQRGNWVFGGEISLTGGFDKEVQRGVNLWGASTGGTMSARIDYLLMSTTRIGYSWGDVLGYLKVGTAGAMVELKTDDNVPPDWTSRDRDFYLGWVLGAGIDYQIMPNLLLGIEYNFVTLDGKTNTTRSDGTVFRSNIDLDAHSVLARLSYKMDAPALANLLPF